jgi:hypothetical protein
VKVALLGNGANDAPLITSAHADVAMGVNGGGAAPGQFDRGLRPLSAPFASASDLAAPTVASSGL